MLKWKKRKEILKNISLGLLILASLFQVMVLWNYRTYGYPSSLFEFLRSGEIVRESDLDEQGKEEFFEPFRISAFSGDSQDQVVWRVYSSNDYYAKIWADTKTYLSRAMISDRPVKLGDDEWIKLIQNKAIVVEMASPIPTELMMWFLNISDASNYTFSSVHKIMISLEGTGRDITIYIKGDGLYRLGPFSPANDEMTKSDYTDVIEELSNKEKMVDYRLFGLAAGLVEGISPDVMSSLTGSIKGFNMYRQSTPEKIADEEVLKKLLLARHIESYETIISGTTITYQTLNNTFVVDANNGFIEHNYSPSYDFQSRGNAGEAFRTAYEVINTIKGILQPATDLYLHSVEEAMYGDVGTYIFKIGYMAGDYPVLMKNGNDASFPLVIQANSRDVISYKWMLKEVRKADASGNYDINFLNFLQDLFITFSMDETQLKMVDAIEGYVFENTYDGSLLPSLLVDTGSAMMCLPMRERQVN